MKLFYSVSFLFAVCALSYNFYSSSEKHSHDLLINFLIEECPNIQTDSRLKVFSPLSMRVHYVLNKNRHGLPHSANIRHINKGWWTKITQNTLNNSKPRVPKNTLQLFQQIKDENFHCLLIRNDNPLLNHISSGYSQFRLKNTFNSVCSQNSKCYSYSLFIN